MRCMQIGCPRDPKPAWTVTEKFLETGRERLLSRYDTAKRNRERHEEEQGGKGKGKCYKCEQYGHLARDCDGPRTGKGSWEKKTDYA